MPCVYSGYGVEHATEVIASKRIERLLSYQRIAHGHQYSRHRKRAGLLSVSIESLRHAVAVLACDVKNMLTIHSARIQILDTEPKSTNVQVTCQITFQ